MINDEINNTFRFRSFPVYKDIRTLRKKIKEYSKINFPKEDQYALTSQLWRAMDSIVLNIAEGMNRYSGKSNSNFINIGIGSLDETVGCIDCAYDDGYISKEKQQEYLLDAKKIMIQLKALSACIRRNDRKN